MLSTWAASRYDPYLATKKNGVHFLTRASFMVACERRRIFSVTGSAENNVCEPELENNFCDITTFVFSLANHIA